MFIWYLFFIVLTFIQATIMPLNLLLVAVISFSILSSSVKTLFLLFWMGLLTDLILLRPIGETSLFFLVLGFLIMLYGQKYQVDSPLFILIFTILATLMENKLFLGDFIWSMVVIHLILILPIYFFMRMVSETLTRNNSRQLKLKI